MTTYQEPPLQSRRAVRQGERVDQSTPPFAPPQTPRTAAGAGEPLSYVTQNRPPLPGYDSAPPRGRRSSTPEPQAAPEQQVASEPQAATSFRPRDFSPEARTAPPAWTPADERDGGVLEHHTQARASVIPQNGASLAASLASEPNEQTLTRRELRAIRDTHGITAAPAEGAPVVAEAPASYIQPAPAAYQGPAAYQPPASYERPAAYQPEAAPQQPQAAPYQPAAPQPAPAPVYQAPAAPQQFAPAPASAPEPSTQLDSAGEASSTSRRAGRRAAPQGDVAPEDGLGAFDAMLAAQAVAPAPQPPVAQQSAPEYQQLHQPAAPAQVHTSAPVESVAAPTTGERPIGHWTTQSDIDDRIQVNESTISRRVGAGAITTSALVLPSIPGHNMSTGEVMLTDSIRLPSSLAETGAHSPIDESDIDHLLDPGDHQLVNTDSVPIRAIKAVSSHTGSRGQVIAHTKPTGGNRTLTALIVSASVMVVVVVTLLVVALATEVI